MLLNNIMIEGKCLSNNHILRYLFNIFILLLIPFILFSLNARGTANNCLPIRDNNANGNYLAG